MHGRKKRVFPTRSWGAFASAQDPHSQVTRCCTRRPGSRAGPSGSRRAPGGCPQSLGKVEGRRSVRGSLAPRERAVSTSGQPGPGLDGGRGSVHGLLSSAARGSRPGQVEQGARSAGSGLDTWPHRFPAESEQGQQGHRERLRKKLSEQESLLLLMSPNMAFLKVHSRNGKVSDRRPRHAGHAPPASHAQPNTHLSGHAPTTDHAHMPPACAPSPLSTCHARRPRPRLPVTGVVTQRSRAGHSPTCRSYPVGHAPLTGHAPLPPATALPTIHIL